MADDVRISVGLPGHPKTKKLKRRLGADGCWALICLFLWTAAERWDGDLTGMSDEDIELSAEWNGEPDAFVAALVEVKYLKGEPGARWINDWQEHNPYAAAKGQRIAKGKRAAEARWGKPRAPDGDAPSMDNDATSIAQGCDKHARSSAKQYPPAPAPSPSPTYPSDSSSHTVPLTASTDGHDGVFEGHDPGVRLSFVPSSPYAAAAIALTQAGVRTTSQNPDLIAAINAGVTASHLIELLAQYPGKPVKYLTTVARRELVEKAADVVAATGGVTNRGLSRQAGAISSLLRPRSAENEGEAHEYPQLV